MKNKLKITHSVTVTATIIGIIFFAWWNINSFQAEQQFLPVQVQGVEVIIQASGAVGDACSQNSNCASGQCFNTCLPSYPITSDLDLNSWSTDIDLCGGGWMDGRKYSNPADAKAQFDSYGGGTAGWGLWTDGSVCGLDVYYKWASPNYIYKAYTTSGIYFALAEDEYAEWGCSDSVIDEIMSYVLCGEGGTPAGPVCGDGNCDSSEDCSSCSSDCGDCASTLKDDGESCSLDTECSGEYCVNGICRSTRYYCGDGYCDGDFMEAEECDTCPEDCGPCLRSINQSCTTDSECLTEHCVHEICRSMSTYCGDGYCDSGETSGLCSEDCTETGSADNGTSCSSNSECSSGYCSNNFCCMSGMVCCTKDAECTSGTGSEDTYCNESDNICHNKGDDGAGCSHWRHCKGGHCVHSICRSSSTHCGDNHCDSGETCSSCSSDCGACSTEPETTTTPETTTEPETTTDSDTSTTTSTETEVDVSEFDDLYHEYRKIINYLEKKIDVTEFDHFNVSPHDMHDAIESLVEGYESDADKQKGIKLLKSAIAAEELGLAVYKAESEMAELLAESSWNSLEAYLLYKIKAIIADRLESLSDVPELTDLVDSFEETAGTVAQGIESGEAMSDDDLTQVLSQLGITDESQAGAIIKAANDALSQAAGNTKRYIEQIESAVKSKYIKAYKQMFISNFEEAISNQMVYFQVGLWHHAENLGNIKDTEVPYEQYQSKIEEMQSVLDEYKDFVLGDDNIFDKAKGMTEKLTTATEVLGNLLDQAAAYGQAADKGASLANKETHLGDAVDKIKEYNEDLNSAIEAAAGVLDLAGKFAESLFGTYEEAKVYAIFFNAYSDWCDAAMGDCVAVLRIPGTDLKVSVESVYELGRKAGMAVDVVVVQVGALAYSLASGVESLFNASMDAFIEIAKTAETKIKEGEIIVKKFAYKTIEGASDQLVAVCSWGASFLGAYNYDQDYSILKEAWAADKSVIDFSLISPAGVKYPGTLSPDGEQSYVVIDNPENGEWKTEIIGQEIDGTEEVQIALNVDEIKPGETKQTLPGYTSKSDVDWTFYAKVFGVVAAVVVVGWLTLKYGIRYLKRKKSSKIEKIKEKVEPILEKAKPERDKQEQSKKSSKRLTLIILAYLYIGGVLFLVSAFVQIYFQREYNEFGWPWVAGNAVAGLAFLYFYHRIQKKSGVKTKILSLIILGIFVAVGMVAVAMPEEVGDVIIDILSYPIIVGGIFIPLIIIVYFARAIIWVLRKVIKKKN